MKGRYLVLLVTAMLLAGVGYGQEFMSQTLNEHAEATIPWKFYMGTKVMPAGEYHFDIGSSEKMIVVHTWDAKSIASATMDHTEAMAASEEPMVVFDKVGGQYFLHKVSDDATKLNFILPPSDREKSLIKEKGK